MKNIKLSLNKIITFVFYANIILLNSCDTVTNPVEKYVKAPSESLSAKEIMTEQGIMSIHFVAFDSVIVNGKSDSAFIPRNEYYIDTCHYKVINLSPNGSSLNSTVYDICKNIGWNYYGETEYLNASTISNYYEIMTKNAIGSRLQGPANYLRTEYIDGKLCNVYEDSTGYQEWIWVKYKFPIQRKIVINNISYQIDFSRKENIEINQKIPNSIYDPPK